MKKVAVISLCGDRFEQLFWNSYNYCDPMYDHDLILVHRNFLGVPPKVENKNGNVIFENKIINGQDVPHKAFGAYRYFFYKYRNDYEYFIFISDDVVLKRDGWLSIIIETLEKHEKIGFGSSQIFNGHKNYPHPSHLRSPFWFAKTEVLNKIEWEFNDDHEGEMKIGNQCTSAGYVGVQIGNKINLGYDATEPNHITQILERQYNPELHPFGKYNSVNSDIFRYYFSKLDEQKILGETIVSPYHHIGKQNVFIDIEPFENLIYYPSLEIAEKNFLCKNLSYNINVLSEL